LSIRLTLKKRCTEGDLDDGGVDWLLVPFDNAFPRALEGLEEDTLLRRARGAKRVFAGVFVLPGSLLVLAAHRKTWRVPLKGGLADLGKRGEQAAKGGGRSGCPSYGFVALHKPPVSSFDSAASWTGKLVAGGKD
jgi:hypothetical protein